MKRRHFSQLAVMAAGSCFTGIGGCSPRSTDFVMSVNGPVPAADLGMTLSHEHVLVDFIGADQVSPDRYDPDKAFAVVLPYLQKIEQLGCRTFFDFTPAYLGRDPMLLRKLSEAARLNIITNTGYYGARDGLYLPAHAFEESADDLAGRWISEHENGIGDTGIRPGFIKIGVNPGPLSAVDAKLVRAGAKAHLATGLTVAVHTGGAIPAFEELDILEEEGVDPSAWIWVHSQVETDVSRHVEAGRRGAWVAFDGVGPDNLDRDIRLLQEMKQNGLLGRVLISQDAGWYSVGEEGGGAFRGYDYLIASFLPALEAAGFTQEEIGQLMVANPASAFTIRVRAAP